MAIFNMEKFKERQEEINKNRDEKLRKIKEKDSLNKEEYSKAKEKFKIEAKENIDGMKLEGRKIKEDFNELKENLTELKKEYHVKRTSNCCPRCESENITSNKKGFGAGKAIVGGAVFGVAGLLAGGIGKNKIQLTCLDCGKQFKL